jgi:hypothetical protein
MLSSHPFLVQSLQDSLIASPSSFIFNMPLSLLFTTVEQYNTPKTSFNKYHLRIDVDLCGISGFRTVHDAEDFVTDIGIGTSLMTVVIHVLGMSVSTVVWLSQSTFILHCSYL